MCSYVMKLKLIVSPMKSLIINMFLKAFIDKLKRSEMCYFTILLIMWDSKLTVLSCLFWLHNLFLFVMIGFKKNSLNNLKLYWTIGWNKAYIYILISNKLH